MTNAQPGIETCANPLTADAAQLRASYLRDGVVQLKQAMTPEWMAQLQTAFEWSLTQPSGTVADYAKSEDSKFYIDTANPAAMPVYGELARRSGLGDLLAQLWGSDHVWYAFEQVFFKEGGQARSQRTGWHQDSSYLSFDGSHIAVVWITLDVLPRDASLEFVRGSHLGPLYEQRAARQSTGRPTVPHIEAARQDFDIVSWPNEPGDALVFHPAILHGGASTQAGTRRRTVSLRFVGDNATFTRRPTTHDTPPTFLQLNGTLKDGDPFRHPAFVQLR